MALHNLRVPIDHVFSCDVNEYAKRTIMANFPPKIFYDDLTQRDNARAPKADLYVAGFPCQPFSSAGLQQGFKDRRGRGKIFFHILDYLEKRKPRVFVLENVSGLVKIKKGEYLRAILKSLENLGVYNLYSQVLDTKEHGVPHSRRRIYIVGIKKRADDGSFNFPEPVPLPSIELFLEPRKSRPTATDLPPPRAGNARANVCTALRDIVRQGADPLKVPFIIDCDSSGPRMKYHRGYTPCMTCSRWPGHWVTNRARRLTKAEMLRLQGIRPESFKVAICKSQLGRQIGNAMSVNVLERLFAKILPAAGLVPHGAVADRWKNGKPPAELTTAGSRPPKRRAAAAIGPAKRRRAATAP